MSVNRGGRPQKKIDYEKLDKLLGIFCTGEECASVLDMDYDTINACLKRDKKVGFSEYSNMKKGVGRASLRRRQFQMAEKNPALAIWLGKQYLGQVDHQEIDQTMRIVAMPTVQINGKELEFKIGS